MVTREVAFAKRIVVDSKANYDCLRLDRAKKERLLVLLQSESEKLTEQMTPEAVSSLAEKFDHVIQLEAELEETMQGFRNENHYSETLQHMIETRKVSLLSKMTPLRRLKETLHSVDTELQSVTKREMQVRVAAESAEVRNRGLEAERETVRVSAAKDLRTLEERYKEKQKLLMYLERERADINDQKRLHSLEVLSGRFQTRLTQLRGTV